MRPIKDAKVPDEVCLKMVEALAAGNSYMKRPGIIHTGIILPEGLRFPIAILRDMPTKLKVSRESSSYLEVGTKRRFEFWVSKRASDGALKPREVGRST